MNIELGKLVDGGLVIVADAPFPDEIRRVEYYRDQSLMMLVYGDASHAGDLMHYELSDLAARVIEGCPNIMIVDHTPNHGIYGYDVPLVQIGI